MRKLPRLPSPSSLLRGHGAARGALSVALLLVACAGGQTAQNAAGGGSGARRGQPSAAGGATAQSSAVKPPPAADTAPQPTASAAASSSSAVPPAPAPRGPLATFHAGLDALKAGKRRDHVRVMWLGDSHAQADFWTDAIRVGLQSHYGVGGPGFIRIGYGDYRHAGATVKVDGSWRMRPKRPSAIEPWGDGAFGLGGILHAGYAGSRRARLTLSDERLKGKPLNVELCYKFGLPNDVFNWSVGGKTSRQQASGPQDVGSIRYLQSRAQGPGELLVQPIQGRPDFCGVVVEVDPATGPGVVLDNLGINGARYATALAWNEQAWAAAVKHRPAPELFVFEYGGNEASDMVIEPERYKRDALALIARAKRIRADASCLVIGPADRADAEDKIPPIVAAIQAAAEQAGCAFWDTYQKMGGKGSLRKWRDESKASPDGVHLKPSGYELLGEWLLRDLIADRPAP